MISASQPHKPRTLQGFLWNDEENGSGPAIEQKSHSVIDGLSGSIMPLNNRLGGFKVRSVVMDLTFSTQPIFSIVTVFTPAL